MKCLCWHWCHVFESFGAPCDLHALLWETMNSITNRVCIVFIHIHVTILNCLIMLRLDCILIEFFMHRTSSSDHWLVHGCHLYHSSILGFFNSLDLIPQWCGMSRKVVELQVWSWNKFINLWTIWFASSPSIEWIFFCSLSLQHLRWHSHMIVDPPSFANTSTPIRKEKWKITHLLRSHKFLW